MAQAHVMISTDEYNRLLQRLKDYDNAMDGQVQRGANLQGDTTDNISRPDKSSRSERDLSKNSNPSNANSSYNKKESVKTENKDLENEFKNLLKSVEELKTQTASLKSVKQPSRKRNNPRSDKDSNPDSKKRKTKVATSKTKKITKKEIAAKLVPPGIRQAQTKAAKNTSRQKETDIKTWLSV